MSQITVSINTTNNLGVYSGFQDVTKYVNLSGLGNVSQKLDNSQYDVGVFRNTNMSISLTNENGKFSDPSVLQSIFINKRIDSIVKVEWRESDDLPICGSAVCGDAILGGDEVLFYGLLNDIASSQNIRDQIIKFSVQGLESIFDRVETNYSSLSVSDNFSTTIYNLLNQSAITALMTVSQSNISVGIEQVPDVITDLQETTVKEALDLLLEASNSVLYVNVADQTVYVKPRTAAASVTHNFYGQASEIGNENIVNIAQVTTGLNRSFNFWKWQGTTLTAKSQSSIDEYGVRKKELNNDLLTNTTKRSNLLNNFNSEFGEPKQELKLTTYLDYSTTNLFLLDRVDIDYPTFFEPTEDDLPLFGTAVFGTDKFPIGQWNLKIDTATNWKIIGRRVNLKSETVEFDLREI